MKIKNFFSISDDLLAKIKDAIDAKYIAKPAVPEGIVFWCDSGCDGGCVGSCLNCCLGSCAYKNKG